MNFSRKKAFLGNFDPFGEPQDINIFRKKIVFLAHTIRQLLVAITFQESNFSFFHCTLPRSISQFCE